MANKKKVSKSTVIESRIVSPTDLAHDTALAIFTTPNLPSGWVASPDEWWQLLQSVSERIQKAIDTAIEQAKVSPQA